MRHEIFRHIDRNGGIGAHQSGVVLGGRADGQVEGQVIVVGGAGGVLEIVVGDGAADRELGGDVDNADAGDLEIVGRDVGQSEGAADFSLGGDVDAGEAALESHLALGECGESAHGVGGRLDIAEGGAHGDGLFGVVAKLSAEIVLGVELQCVEVALCARNAHALSVGRVEVGSEEEVFFAEETLDTEDSGVRAARGSGVGLPGE